MYPIDETCWQVMTTLTTTAGAMCFLANGSSNADDDYEPDSLGVPVVEIQGR